MKHISFVKSLMEFDKRVLEQGTPVPNKSYNLSDLKSLLFFNSVFMGNTNEIFEKQKYNSIIDDYVSSLNKYIANVANIIKQMMVLKREIKFTREDSFERRFAMSTQLDNQVITQFYTSISQVNYRFKSGHLYYISILQNGQIAISFVDPKRSIYSEPLCCKFNDHVLYWKTDDCIRDFIKADLGAVDTVAVKITMFTKNVGVITKAEYNGNTSTAKVLAPIFGKYSLLISNPFIYLDDISQIISKNDTEKAPEQKPVFRMIEALDLLEEDELIEYPLDSFNDYLEFLRSAAMNPEVKEIYLTLYRIGNDPSIFYILRDAVNKGIRVHVNIELCASGEKINKVWMREMLNAGIDVTTYASGVIKIHSKLTLVKFNNGRSIAQIGTGNYHTKTTTQYTDLSLITADDDICIQVEKVFKIFEGREDVEFNNNLLVTRYNAREELINMIDEEAEKREKGFICIKCNALDDDEIIKHLDDAATMGCRIDLIIRGVCTWVPDEIGSTVKIKSIVWDKLEHSRVYCFGCKDPQIFIGSLDLVTSKIDNRIETLVRINDPNILIKLCKYLNRYITSAEGSWIMTRDGEYVKE